MKQSYLERRSIVNKANKKISINRQCQLLSIHRSGFYYKAAISMDGKGRATDNIFVERLWRSLKYEAVYLRAYEDGLQLFQGLKKYFNFYNLERRHSRIKDNFPYEKYKDA